MAGRVGLAALVASLGLLSLAGCGGTGESKPAGRVDWSQPNANDASTRAVPGPPAPADGDRLRVRWRFRLRGEPGFSGIDAATPVVSAGRVYLQDLNSDVYALSLADGHLLWHHRYRRPDGGPNGLAVANGVVYGNTDTSAFALSARTGVERWRSRLTRPGNPVTIAPLVANGLVYTSSTGQSPGGRGTLFALDTKTGAVRWRFDTIVGPWRFPREASGGGAWHPPSVDATGASTGEPPIRIPGAGRAPGRTEGCTRGPSGTPTRSSSSTAEPASCSGATRSRPTTCATTTSNSRRC